MEIYATNHCLFHRKEKTDLLFCDLEYQQLILKINFNFSALIEQKPCNIHKQLSWYYRSSVPYEQ